MSRRTNQQRRQQSTPQVQPVAQTVKTGEELDTVTIYGAVLVRNREGQGLPNAVVLVNVIWSNFSENETIVEQATAFNTGRGWYGYQVSVPDKPGLVLFQFYPHHIDVEQKYRILEYVVEL